MAHRDGRRGSREFSASEYGPECCPPRRRRGRSYGAAIVGLGVLMVGLLLTLDNLGWVDTDRLWPYWPVLFVLLGVSYLVRPAADRRLSTGIIWIVIGAIILLYNFDMIDFNVWDLWPILLVILGAKMLFRAFVRGRSQATSDSGSFDATAILGGANRRISVDDFSGGTATAMLGGCEIDLRDAGSSGPPAVIDCFAFWGGVDIKVPQDWDVQVRGTAILGAFEDKTVTVDGDTPKVLEVRGMAIMGGVEVKN